MSNQHRDGETEVARALVASGHPRLAVVVVALRRSPRIITALGAVTLLALNSQPAIQAGRALLALGR